MIIVDTLFFVFLFLLLIAGGAYVISLYNSLVQVRVDVDTAWSNVDVLLKQRHDELGKLLDAVKNYMGYERDLLAKITMLRSQTGSGGQGAQRLEAESALSAGIGRLFAVAENYPNLRASEEFGRLEGAITDLEQQIARRREFYNAEVNINNTRCAQVPDSFVAPMAGLHPHDLFQASSEERADVNVDTVLKS
ncbi:MAG TPA: LemA family protein [Candidatus Baltobacteraceae bacterium]|jgi:LemA protein|nr:LemA family protein [Candidatus Baltobacteraceae bacterium]